MCNTITSTTVAQKPALLISACLLGVRCRYDGQSRGLSEKTIRQLREQYELVPVCPEILGGLPTHVFRLRFVAIALSIKKERMLQMRISVGQTKHFDWQSYFPHHVPC